MTTKRTAGLGAVGGALVIAATVWLTSSSDRERPSNADIETRSDFTGRDATTRRAQGSAFAPETGFGVRFDGGDAAGTRYTQRSGVLASSPPPGLRSTQGGSSGPGAPTPRVALEVGRGRSTDVTGPDEQVPATGTAIAAAGAANVPSELGGHASEDPGRAGAGTDRAPDAPVLSLPLKDSTAAEDATTPILEEEVKPAVEGHGFDFGKDSVVAFANDGKLRGDAGTVSFDLEPHWDGTDSGDNTFVQVRTPGDAWQGRLAVLRNGRYLTFVFFDDNGVEHGVGLPVDGWVAGQSHQVVATWGDALMALHVDGQLAAQATYDAGPAIPPDSTLYVGRVPSSHIPGADANLQNIQIFGAPVRPQ